MSPDFSFTFTSWFLGNVRVKPYFNTQCPLPSGFSEHPRALNLLMLMAPSSTSFLNNESARLLPDKRHSKVGTRPEAFHNVCQNWPFFQPFWNQTGHQIWIGLESVSLISSFIQCEFCYLLSEKLLIFQKVLSNLTLVEVVPLFCLILSECYVFRFIQKYFLQT